MKRPSLLLLFCGILCLLCNAAHAQQAHFASPVNNASNVAVQPTIRLITAHKIDSSSVKWTPIDTNRTAPNLYNATIQVVPKALADALPDSLWQMFARPGTYSLVNDSTLDFDVAGLDFSTQYVAKVRSLRTIDAGDTTYVTSDVSTTFRTVPAVHRPLSASILSNYLTVCNPDVKITFNRTLDSANTPIGPLVQMVRLQLGEIDTTKADSEQVPWHYDTVASSSWVDASDHSILHIQPVSDLTMDGHYGVCINTGNLNGDSLSNRVLPFQVRSKTKVELTMGSVNPLETLPTSDLLTTRTGTYTFAIGDTIIAKAPAKVGDFTFLNWQSIEDPSLNTSSNTVTISYNCENAKDVKLKAMYVPTPTDTVVISSNMGIASVCNQVYVRTTHSDTVASVGTFRVPRGTTFTVVAGDTCGPFHHWHATGVSVTDSTRRVITFATNGNVTLSANPGVLSADPTLTGNIILQDENGQTISKGNVVSVNSTAVAELVQDVYTSTTPEDHDMELKMDADGYEVIKVVIAGPDYPNNYVKKFETDPIRLGTGERLLVKNTNSHFTDLPSNTRTTVSSTEVTFILRPTFYDLNIEVAFEDNSVPEGGIKKDDGDAFPYWVALKYSTGGYIQKAWNTQHIHSGSEPYYGETYKIPSGTSVKLEAAVAPAGYRFVRWEATTGFDYSPVSVISPLVMNKNHHVRAVFQRTFSLVEVGFDIRSGSTVNLTWFKVKDLVDEVKPVAYGSSPSFFRGKPCFDVRLKFSAPVDDNSFVPTTNKRCLTCHALYAYDLDLVEKSYFAPKRYDGQSPQLYVFDKVNSVINYSLVGDGSVVLLHMGNADANAVKITHEVLQINNYIKSQAGAYLDQSYTIPFLTEAADVKVTFHKYQLHDDQDPDFIVHDHDDPYSEWLGNLAVPGQDNWVATQQAKGKIPNINTQPPAVGDGDWVDPVGYLCTFSRVPTDAYTDIGVVTKDYDDATEIVNALNFLAKADSIIAAALPDSTGMLKTGIGAVGVILKAAAIWAASGTDDFINNNEWFYGIIDLWGYYHSDEKTVKGSIDYYMKYEIQ